MENYGLLGGTFDPVHLSHLRLAEIAVRQLSLDKIIFIPSAHPPHKTSHILTPFHHRVEMLKLAGKGYHWFEVSTVERSLPAPSYSVDTVALFTDRDSKNKEFYFLIGSDAFLDLQTWKMYKVLLHTIHFVIGHRKGVEPTKLFGLLDLLGYKEGRHNVYFSKEWKTIHFLDETPEQISSTEIRQRLSKGQDTEKLLNKNVSLYIKKNQLY